jgi:farnesyl-diphosphate farnesyltransferase
VIVRSVEKIAAVKETGAGVIDTESSGWAAAAAKFGVPFVAIRAVFDPAEEKLPDFIGEHVDRFAVVRHALTHPNVIPSLLRLRKRVRVCAEALAEVVARAVADPATRLHELLVETSRTFALCIPLLPDAVRQQVTIAYLLFRIADTFEDASHWPVADRLAALDDFCTLLRNPDPDEARRLANVWHGKGPSEHAGYVALIADVPLVIRAFAALPDAAMAIIRDHVIRSSEGMAHFVALTENGTLQLTNMEQLRAYCYAVAGIVGEMLTELFLLRAPQLRSTAPFLRARAATFGEGLQLVNILKDSLSDLSEGRTYIPPDAERADVMALARADLEAATEYTLALQSGGAPHGIVAFAALPVALAEATLDKLEVSQPGTKIGRAEVFRITRMVNQSVARGEPPLRRKPQNASGLARLRSIFSLR